MIKKEIARKDNLFFIKIDSQMSKRKRGKEYFEEINQWYCLRYDCRYCCAADSHSERIYEKPV